MKKVLFPLLAVVLALGLAIPMAGAAPAAAHTAEEPYTTPLMAGQNIEVGNVSVWNDGENLYVKYEITEEGWFLTETHLAVATSLDDIPQKNGNPPPGQFPYSREYDLADQVTEDTYVIPLDGQGVGTKLFIAAHAVVGQPAVTHIESSEFCIASGIGTSVVVNGGVAATLAWVHPLWNESLTMPLYEDADWIWESERVSHPVNGDIVEFQQEFNIAGTPVNATLYITADNAFEAYVNGNFVGDSGNLKGDWRNSTLTEEYVDTSAGISSWATVRVFDVSALIETGPNVLAVTGVNEQMDSGTIDSNPAGVIYKLCGTSEVEVVDVEEVSETAWGFGPGFTGKNWATYFTYTVQGWQELEEVEVMADGTIASSTEISDSDSSGSYKLVANGTYKFANWGDAGIADAKYSLRPPGKPYSYHSELVNTWVNGADIPSPYTHYLQVWGGDPLAPLAWDWDGVGYNPDHEYTVFLTGDGATMQFRILDNAYGDNSGSITVTIYKWE